MFTRRLSLAICLLPLSLFNVNTAHAKQQPVAQSILTSYADIAATAYNAALTDAKQMQQAISTLAASPSEATLNQAKQAWLTARESYGQTEIFRLSNGPIDAEEGWVASAYGAPEGQLNAWPLDENMIDYTVDEDGKLTSGNIIDTKGTFTPGGEDAQAIDVTTITADALAALNENGGDANVSSGYHAIEFLLWGQDQDYANFTADTVTNGALVAGQRPLTDFTTAANADRRLAYLSAASSLIVADLAAVNSAWAATPSNNCDKEATGCYRAALLGKLSGNDSSKNIAADEALKTIIMSMGVFIKSELANERIAVAVLTPSEEDEHSCFSDNTHRDISLNYQGFTNVLRAQYAGKTFGKSLYDLSDAKTQTQLNALMNSIDGKIAHMNKLADTKWHFDYQILPQNNASEIKAMKNEMRQLGDLMIGVAKSVDLQLTTEDVTDAEETKL